MGKWVDYSDKYGFGYSLNDDSIGVVFNDLTKLLLLADGTNIHYIDYEQSEHYYTLNEFPATVEKKVKLLNYFRKYMREHLLKAGANMEVREEDALSSIPALKTWFRTYALWLCISPMVLCRTTSSKIIPRSFSARFWEPSPTMTRRGRTGPSGFDLLEKHGCTTEWRQPTPTDQDKSAVRVQ